MNPTNLTARIEKRLAAVTEYKDYRISTARESDGSFYCFIADRAGRKWELKDLYDDEMQAVREAKLTIDRGDVESLNRY